MCDVLFRSYRDIADNVSYSPPRLKSQIAKEALQRNKMTGDSAIDRRLISESRYRLRLTVLLMIVAVSGSTV
jgi:hypothetical protein